MNWYIDAWKNYVNFQGRARRKAYWMFALFNIIAIIVLGVIEGAIGLSGQSGYGILTGLYSLAIILPGLAGTQRMVDPHRPGSARWPHRAPRLLRARQPARQQPIRSESQGVGCAGHLIGLRASYSVSADACRLAGVSHGGDKETYPRPPITLKLKF